LKTQRRGTFNPDKNLHIRFLEEARCAKFIVCTLLVLSLLVSCSNLNKAAKLKSNEAIDSYNSGIANSKLLQYHRAIQDYNKAIRLKPDFANAYYNRGSAYYKLGLMQRSIQDYNEAIRLKPDYADAYNNRGIIYFLQGNKEQGCRDARKACDLGLCKLLERFKSKGYCR